MFLLPIIQGKFAEICIIVVTVAKITDLQLDKFMLLYVQVLGLESYCVSETMFWKIAKVLKGLCYFMCSLDTNKINKC